MGFETIFDASNATVYKFETIGDVLEGYYMGSFPHEGDYGPTKKHIFDTKNGAICVFGQKHLLDTLPTVKPGTMVRVTYASEIAPKAKGRQAMKLFKFEQDKSRTIEVTGVELTPTSPAAETDGFEAVDTDTTPADEIAPARASRPATPARSPSAAQQAAVRNVLSGKR